MGASPCAGVTGRRRRRRRASASAQHVRGGAPVGEGIGGQHVDHRGGEAGEDVRERAGHPAREVALRDVDPAERVGERVGRELVRPGEAEHPRGRGGVEREANEGLGDIADVNGGVALTAAPDHRDRRAVPRDEGRGARAGLVGRPEDERRAHDHRVPPAFRHETLGLALRAQVGVVRARVGPDVAEEGDSPHRRAGERVDHAPDRPDVRRLVRVLALHAKGPGEMDHRVGVRQCGDQIIVASDRSYRVRGLRKAGLDEPPDVSGGSGDRNRPCQPFRHPRSRASTASCRQERSGRRSDVFLSWCSCIRPRIP